jgi:hypothetical protein
MLIFPLRVADLQILHNVLTPLFGPNKYPFFDFSITHPGKLISQIRKSSTILIHCLDEIVMSPSVMCNGDKKLLMG